MDVSILVTVTEQNILGRMAADHSTRRQAEMAPIDPCSDIHDLVALELREKRVIFSFYPCCRYPSEYIRDLAGIQYAVFVGCGTERE
jgi:hypothetical protein